MARKKPVRKRQGNTLSNGEGAEKTGLGYGLTARKGRGARHRRNRGGG